MTRIPRTRRWLSVPARTAGRSGHRWQPPPGPPDPWAGDSEGTGTPPVAEWPSFRRIVPIAFGAWMAALERWQLTGPGSELRLGHTVLRGPAEHDPHFGTCRIEAHLARGPLRPPARMRLGIDHWSATATVLELIPHRRVQPTAAYFRAGRDLLEALTHALPQPAVPRPSPAVPARARADAQGPQLHPDLTAAGMLDLTVAWVRTDGETGRGQPVQEFIQG
jgi:hypothetical protein